MLAFPPTNRPTTDRPSSPSRKPTPSRFARFARFAPLLTCTVYHHQIIPLQRFLSLSAFTAIAHKDDIVVIFKSTSVNHSATAGKEASTSLPKAFAFSFWEAWATLYTTHRREPLTGAFLPQASSH